MPQGKRAPSVEDINESSLWCRVGRHAWSRPKMSWTVTESKAGVATAGERTLTCVNDCGVGKRERFTFRGNRAIREGRAQYVYPDGYLAPKGERVDLEVVQFALFQIDAKHVKPKPTRARRTTPTKTLLKAV